MAEENQVKQGSAEPQQAQQVTKEPQRVTTKDSKKVEAGKRQAAINRKKREEQAQLEKTTSRVNQHYGIGVVIAVGVIGGLGYHIYWSKKGEVPNRDPWPPTPWNPPQQPRPQATASQPQTNKFEMD